MFQDKLHCFPQFDPQSIVIHGVLNLWEKLQEPRIFEGQNM